MARINLLSLVETQRSERYRGLIIHAEAMGGKTETAQALVKRTPDATYLDILALARNKPELWSEIDRFDLSQLERFLIDYPASGQVLIVDHLDLLLNTWTAKQRAAFAQWVDDGLDGFADSERVLVFFIQTDGAVVNYKMKRRNRLGLTRTFALSDFDAL